MLSLLSVLRYHIKFTVGPICCAAHLLYVTVETVLKADSRALMLSHMLVIDGGVAS